jgi:hypothetical protein
MNPAGWARHEDVAVVALSAEAPASSRVEPLRRRPRGGESPRISAASIGHVDAVDKPHPPDRERWSVPARPRGQQ